MSISEQPQTPLPSNEDASPHAVVANVAPKERSSIAAIVASAYGKIDVALRARLLSRLLGAVGPLALAVVGGGVFAKYLRHARWSEIPVTLEDAARATSNEVYDLVRYVEQSNPHVVDGLLAALARWRNDDRGWCVNRGCGGQAAFGSRRLRERSVGRAPRARRGHRHSAIFFRQPPRAPLALDSLRTRSDRSHTRTAAPRPLVSVARAISV